MSDYNQGNSQGQQGQPRPKRVTDHFGTKLYTKPINGSTRKPSLAFGLYKNMPVITVYTGLEGDKDNGRIEVKLDVASMAALSGMVQKAIENKAENRIVLESADFTFISGKKSDAPKLQSKVAIGRDANGVVYIAVASWDNNRPNVKFPLLPTGYRTFYQLSGEKMTDGEVSDLMAAHWLKGMFALLTNLMTDHYVHEAPKQFGGGQGGGGYNRGGQGNYGGGNRGGGNYGQGGGNSYQNQNQNRGGGNDSGYREEAGTSFNGDDDLPL